MAETGQNNTGIDSFVYYDDDNDTFVSDNNSTLFMERPAMCGTPEDVGDYQYWFDGVLVSVIAVVGFVGNLLAIIVLSRPKLRDVFHQLLLALACFDILYIVCGSFNYTFRAFHASSDVFTYLFPYLIYPMTHVSLAGTIFMTVAISIERYLGLCYPLLSPHSRKAWFYVVPVIAISFALNVPKFMEVQLGWIEINGTDFPSYGPTDLRFNETYIRGYIMWTRLFWTAVIPVALLLFLNTRIAVDLFGSTKVQRFGSARRQRKEFNLCLVLLCIVVVFFLCHTARIAMDVHEFSNVEKIIACKRWNGWLPAFWSQALLYISHTMMILNSSFNFVIYCLVGHMFRRELCRTLGMRRYAHIPAAGQSTDLSRRSSRNEFAAMGNGGGTRLTTAATTTTMVPMKSFSAFPEEEEEEYAEEEEDAIIELVESGRIRFQRGN